MLKSIKVKNFMGFKDELLFDLSKTRTYAFKENLIKDKIVNKGIVYGRNATGKSNLGLAIFDIVNVLTDNYKDKLLTIQNYINLDSDEDIVEFEYSFLLDGKTITYKYGKLDPLNIVYEELLINNRVQLHFDVRENKEKVVMKLKGNNKINLQPYINLYDLKAENYNLSLLKYVYRSDIWDKDSIIVKLFSFVNNMLWVRSLNFGNEFIGLTPNISNIEEIIINANKVNDFQKFLNDNGINYKLQVGVRNGQQIICVKFKNRLVDLASVMSNGTAYLRLYYSWSILFDKVSFLYLDEFDAYYHYDTAEFIVKELEKYPNMQTIITTHNTYLMNNDIVRPDACFILSNNGIHCLSDCTNKEIREAHNLEKMYINGAFINE